MKGEGFRVKGLGFRARGSGCVRVKTPERGRSKET